MTEKRFQIFGSVVEDTLGIISITLWQDKKQQKKFCAELNALHEENIRLKRDFDSCSHNWSMMYDEAKEKVEKLTEENWELEQENERLENKLWNCQNVR